MKILILGAGEFHVKTIREIREAGFKVFTVDKDPFAPGFLVSDGYAVIDIVDKTKYLGR